MNVPKSPILILCLLLNTASAATISWTNTLGGDFSDAGNWDSGVPGTNDLAFFNTESAGYTVDVTANASVQTFRVVTDILDLNIASGQQLTITSDGEFPARIGNVDGNIAYVTLSGGGQFYDHGGFTIAYQAGSYGSLIVSNGTLVNAANEFNVGRGGEGFMHIASNGVVDSYKVIMGSYQKGDGTVSVDGGSWNYDVMVCGWDGPASITASNGATLRGTDGSKTFWMGYASLGSGSLTLSGQNTTCSNAQTMLIGYESAAEVSVSDMAALYSKCGRLGLNAGARGQVIIDNGMWLIEEDLSIGGNTSSAGGSGIMQIKNGSTVIAGGPLAVWDDGILQLQDGTLQAASLDVASSGAFRWNAGTLILDELSVGSLGPFNTLELSSGMTLTLANNLTVESTGMLMLRGGDVSCNKIVLDGGVISSPNGFVMDSSFDFSGEGVVAGAVSGGTGETITANGDLVMGLVSSTTGYNFDGTLNINNASEVVLLDANRARLGVQTTLSDGSKLTGANGLRVDPGETMTAEGNAFIQGDFYNDGTVDGPSGAGEAFTFDDPVSGPGTFTGNITFNQTYSPGSSPASVSFGSGDVSFPAGSILVMEIDGPTEGTEFDCLRNIAELSFGGTLEILFNYLPASGTEFDLLDFASLSGAFDEITVTGLPSSMRLDISRLESDGIVRALTPMEPDHLDLRVSSGNRLEATFEGDTGLMYTLQCASNIVTPSWSEILTTNFLSTPFPWIEFETDTNSSVQYYRVVLE